MARPGNPGTPTKILRLRDSNRVYRKRADEPDPEPCEPSIPSWLDREAKTEWRRLVKHLSALGILCHLDRTILAEHCRCVSQVVKLVRRVANDGVTVWVTNRQGERSPRRNPDFAAELEMWKRIEATGGLLGLSPADRARVRSVGKKKDADGKARFFTKKTASRG